MAATISGPAGPVTNYSIITATWLNITAPVHRTDRSDWWGIYLTTATDSEPTAWRQTDGGAGGVAGLFLPNIVAGTYELRLFSGHTSAKLATSASFALTAGTAPTLTATPSSPSANTPLTVSWAGIVDPQPGDFILLTAPSAVPGPPLPLVYAQVGTGGAASGSADLFIPSGTPDGDAILLLYRAAIPAAGLDVVWIGPVVHVTITHDLATAVSLPDPPVLAGTDITVSWQRLTAPLPTDWLGLYAVGGTVVLAWRYTNGQATGALPFHIPDNLSTANYELRLSRMTNAVLLATSPAFTITAVA